MTLPKEFSDLSEILPVSDNQEVFTDLKYDAKLIIEILECLEPNDEKAIEANFNEVRQIYLFVLVNRFIQLADANNATEPNIIVHKMVNDEVPKINDVHVKKSILKGTQKVSINFHATILSSIQQIIPSKNPDDEREDVTLMILHLRLKNYDSDILFTLNIPNKSGMY